MKTNSKTTKRALMSSVFALFLCFVMLLGTTFAWFTDNASVKVSTIQAGELDIAVEVKDGSGWQSIEGRTISFLDNNGNSDILWEPGATFATPAIRIVNKGDLGLKYKIAITGIGGDAKLNEVIEWGYQTELGSIGGTGWTSVYPLANLASEANLVPAGSSMGVSESVIRLVGHMKETAGNEYQKLKIEDIAITVYATQSTYESDINGNTYDANAEYKIPTYVTSAELAAIFNENVDTTTNTAVVNITKDYYVTDSWTPIAYKVDPYTVRMADLTINGNGHTIYGLNNALLDEASKVALNITINDLTINGSTVTGVAGGNKYHAGAFIGYADNSIKNITLNNCHAIDVTITGVNGGGSSAGGLVGYLYTHDNASVLIKNCSVTGSTITNAGGNAAGLVGMLATGGADNSYVIEDCSVSGCSIVGETTGKTGALVGTVCNDGRLDINRSTFDGSYNICGRIVGTTTAVYVDNTKIN